jgi:hypothetical protein
MGQLPPDYDYLRGLHASERKSFAKAYWEWSQDPGNPAKQYVLVSPPA